MGHKTFLPDAAVCKGFGALTTSVPCHGTEVYFPCAKPVISVIREQFWGRAVRASRDSQESGALLIFVATTGCSSPLIDPNTAGWLVEPEKNHAQADVCDALESEPGSM